MIWDQIRTEREVDFLLQQLTLERMPPYFFVVCHHHYAHYITQHLLEMRHLLPSMANAELMSGAFVCRHQEGSWNGVCSDQFGGQTAIRIGKCGLKGITLSPEMVAKWIDSLPMDRFFCLHIRHNEPHLP